MKTLLLLVGVATTTLACAPTLIPLRMRSAEDSCGPPSQEMAPLASLGQDPKPFDVRYAPEENDNLPSAQPTKTDIYTYRFEQENAGTEETLRAIVAPEGQPPRVVGHRGLALSRDSKAGWIREATGTEENLYALVHLPIYKNGVSTEESNKQANSMAVGGHGTALLRTPDGVWQKETTGTDADLFAITRGGGSVVAVGAGGVMVERSAEGVWHDVPTYTKANLYGIGRCMSHICAVGAGGVVVECAAPKGVLACVPREPPTKSDLYVVTDEEMFLGDGVWLGLTPTEKRDLYPPPLWSPWRFADDSVEKADARAYANNHWMGIAGKLIAGRRGAAWLVGNWVITKKPVRRIQLPYAVDFYGASYNLVDGFLVGEKGTIVKVGVLGFVPPRMCLL